MKINSLLAKKSIIPLKRLGYTFYESRGRELHKPYLKEGSINTFSLSSQLKHSVKRLIRLARVKRKVSEIAKREMVSILKVLLVPCLALERIISILFRKSLPILLIPKTKRRI